MQKMVFIRDNYKLTLEQDYEGIDIYLFDIEDDSTPLIFLKLKPLNDIDTDFDDKTVIRDIPRHLFLVGDFYQSSVAKYNNTVTYKKISLLSIIHEILLENRAKLNFLNNIYSTSLNNYKEDDFITIDAKNFWNKQLEKAPKLPISFFQEDKRYKLTINE
ncbi:hypothetical protein [Flavobacterium macrobrachii]|uniref:hypothetical protein n=1 Tax=Flavobacterium macrobrachii TaxID=591204 RepID=UPI003F6E8983